MADVLSNLALIQMAKHEYSNAETSNTRALAFKEAAVGPDHPDIAAMLLRMRSKSRWVFRKSRVMTIGYAVSDNCDPAPACSLSVVSNEGGGGGRGHTSPDWVVLDALNVDLRSERDGTGRGRVYTVTINCQDKSGLSSTASTTVTVAHDQGNGKGKGGGNGNGNGGGNGNGNGGGNGNGKGKH